MGGCVSLRVEGKRGLRNRKRTLGTRRELDFVDAVLDASLLFAGHVHDVKGKKLAGDTGECDVEVDFHFLA